MTSDSDQMEAAGRAAEEILQAIYGDDLTGCAVRLETVAAVVFRAMRQAAEIDREMLGLYEKAVEALHLLSTPPVPGTLPAPQDMLALLSDRLDAIRQLTQKLIATNATLKAQESSSPSS